MAADSVQVGKVDNCCEKFANLLQRCSYTLANSFNALKLGLLRVRRTAVKLRAAAGSQKAVWELSMD